MTTDEKQNLRDDIAFMRALADEGVSPPLLAGPILIFAGTVFGAASLFAYVSSRFMTLPWWVQPAVFIGLMVVFMICMPLRLRYIRSRPGYNSPANRAVGQAWAGIGWGIFAFIIAVQIACFKLKSGAPAMMIPTVVLVLYGSAWTVAAAMTKQRFLWVTAAVSYVSAAAVALFVGMIETYLIFAVILVLVAVVPGYLLWKREPRDIV